MSTAATESVRHQNAAHRPDSLIEIANDACGMPDSDRADEILELGDRRAWVALRGEFSETTRAAKRRWAHRSKRR